MLVESNFECRQALIHKKAINQECVRVSLNISPFPLTLFRTAHRYVVPHRCCTKTEGISTQKSPSDHRQGRDKKPTFNDSDHDHGQVVHTGRWQVWAKFKMSLSTTMLFDQIQGSSNLHIIRWVRQTHSFKLIKNRLYNLKRTKKAKYLGPTSPAIEICVYRYHRLYYLLRSE